MAQKGSVLAGYLSCHVCSETYRDPVSLSCNHSFCSSCLKKTWERAKDKTCPICKSKSKIFPSVNFPLKELADSFAKMQNNGMDKEAVLCDKHPEVPYWFCEDEQRAVCPVCEFSLHHSHKLIPIEHAVSEMKDQLRSDLKSLQDKKDKYEELEETYNDVFQYSKHQLLASEKQIKAEINKLHQFLKEEEESRLAALWEEEEQKGKMIIREIKMIQEQIFSLSDNISAVEEDLQKHNVPFLNTYKPTQNKARAQCLLPDPQMVSGAPIDVAKHLGNLSFRVWEKVKEKVHFSPVILDPNTASPCLILSDDLTSVRHGDTKQQLPGNPERCTNYANVLGSEGFSSGKHSWEVEVGDHPRWHVGVARESANRKGERLVSPEYGIWCLWHGDGKYTNGAGKIVRVKKSLQRIRVLLEYDRGRVTFYNAEDMAHVYTHRGNFNEKIFPHFYIEKGGDAKITQIAVPV